MILLNQNQNDFINLVVVQKQKFKHEIVEHVTGVQGLLRTLRFLDSLSANLSHILKHFEAHFRTNVS